MRKPRIAMKLSPRSYDALVALANRVIAALTGNLSFPTPAIPLATLQTQTTAVENGIAAWRHNGNYGSYVDLATLRQQALSLHQLLTAEAKYVETTAQFAA